MSLHKASLKPAEADRLDKSTKTESGLINTMFFCPNDSMIFNIKEK